MNTIKKSKVVVRSAEDLSVGMYPMVVEFGPKGDVFEFESKEDLKKFEELIRHAFEYVCDTPSVLIID